MVVNVVVDVVDVDAVVRHICRWGQLGCERRTWVPWMGKATFVAANFEMVGFDTPVRPLLNFEVAEDVLLDGADYVVDGGEDPFRSLGRKVDLVVHVFVAEFEMIERDVLCADFLGATLHFRSEESGLIPISSIRRRIDGRVDDEDGLRFGVRLKVFRQFRRLRFCCSL